MKSLSQENWDFDKRILVTDTPIGKPTEILDPIFWTRTAFWLEKSFLMNIVFDEGENARCIQKVVDWKCAVVLSDKRKGDEVFANCFWRGECSKVSKVKSNYRLVKKQFRFIFLSKTILGVRYSLLPEGMNEWVGKTSTLFLIKMISTLFGSFQLFAVKWRKLPFQSNNLSRSDLALSSSPAKSGSTTGYTQYRRGS